MPDLTSFVPESARRIANVVRRVENARPSGEPLRFRQLVNARAKKILLRGTFDGVWTKSGTATVDVDGEEYSAKNYFSTVGAAGQTKACAIAYVGDEWILIAAECP